MANGTMDEYSAGGWTKVWAQRKSDYSLIELHNLPVNEDR